MTQKRKSVDALERSIAKTERSLFMNGLYENVYAARKHAGKKSVRLVVDKANRIVHPISADAEALHDAVEVLGSDELTIDPIKLREISEDDLVKELQQNQHEAARKLMPKP